MLKLIYTEVDVQLERLSVSIEAFVTQRTLLALRLGQPIHVVQGRAAFLLPADLPELAQLDKAWASLDAEPDIEIFRADADYIEVGLHGLWVTPETASEEGLFLSLLGDRLERSLEHLWQVAQTQMSFLR